MSSATRLAHSGSASSGTLTIKPSAVKQISPIQVTPGFATPVGLVVAGIETVFSPVSLAPLGIISPPPAFLSRNQATRLGEVAWCKHYQILYPLAYDEYDAQRLLPCA